MDIQFSVQRLLLGAAIAVISLGTQGAELVGQVVAFADGDTLTVLDGERRQYRVWLQGIDAPEKGQDYWRVSKQSLADRVTVRRKQVPEAPPWIHQPAIPGRVRTAAFFEQQNRLEQSKANHHGKKTR